MKFGDLIYVQKNSLDRDFCNKLIEKFNSHSSKSKGVVGAGYRPETKQSIDLNITNVNGFDEEDSVISDVLSKALLNYHRYAKTVMNDAYGFGSVEDSGFQIQRTEPNGFYSWHHDALTRLKSADENSVTIQKRIITYIWYLNDVKENGYTEFIDGTRIQPEAGTLVLFPAEEVYVHRGYPPKSEVKYLMTGWVWVEKSFDLNE